jgi:hypothetical protein
MDLRKTQFKDELEDEIINFMTDAPQKTIDVIHEIERHVIKGYGLCYNRSSKF